jgi:hypothetical protein
VESLLEPVVMEALEVVAVGTLVVPELLTRVTMAVTQDYWVAVMAVAVVVVQISLEIMAAPWLARAVLESSLQLQVLLLHEPVVVVEL